LVETGIDFRMGRGRAQRPVEMRCGIVGHGGSSKVGPIVAKSHYRQRKSLMQIKLRRPGEQSQEKWS
jgi:hypothetical protein